ncbi:MAG TPA: ATP-binding protein [Longimicrobiales bacterium]|nr:ATP-binding protein [Longimicrobiales bacterium]
MSVSSPVPPGAPPDQPAASLDEVEGPEPVASALDIGFLPSWEQVRDRLFGASPWKVLSGPIATCAALLVLEVLAALGVDLVPIPVVALVLVLYSAVVGGLLPGVAAAALVSAYYAYFVGVPGDGFGSIDLRPFYILATAAPAAALAPRVVRDWFGELFLQSDTEKGRALERARFLAEANALLDTSLGFPTTVERLTRLPVPRMATWTATYVYDRQGTLRRVAVQADREELTHTLDNALRRAPLSPNHPHPLEGVEAAAENGEPLRKTPDARAHLALYARTNQERLALEFLQPRALLMVPMYARGRTVGTMVFARAGENAGFSRADVELASEFCMRASLAAESARLYDTAVAAQAEAEAASVRVSGILESLTDGFLAFDDGWRFTYVNGAGERLCGRSRQDLLGRDFWEAFPELLGTRFQRVCTEAAQQRRTRRIELQMHSFAAAPWLEVNIFPSVNGVSMFCRDISSRREVEQALSRSEAQLRQSQKMEAVGRLAGGVAHDFNNILMSIMGYAELVGTRLPDGDEGLRADMTEIRRAAERAQALTRQLLAFSRKQVHEPRPLDVNEVIEQVQRMLRRLIGEDVALVTHLSAELGTVRADPTQIEQILLNLAVNARDAMPAGGILTVETANEQADPARDFGSHDLTGPCIRISVIDTGEGIDEEALPNIFEPFFTTKPKGKGTGLGLATVYGVVTQLGGDIAVASSVGRGTRFDILLPREAAEPVPLDADAAGSPLEPADVPADASAIAVGRRRARPAGRGMDIPTEGGGGVILVVEDEDAVRRYVCDVLRLRGYEVLEADHGLVALELLAGGVRPDLVLTDVVMPEMGGRELAERLVADHPGLRVLFMSGYAESEVAHEGALDPGTDLLEKPFGSEALLQAVRAGLARPIQGAA